MPSTWFQGQVCCCVRETYHAYLAGLRWSLRLMTELMLFPLRSFPQTTPRAEGNPPPICTERTEGTIECGKHHAQQPLSISPTLGNTLGATQPVPRPLSISPPNKGSNKQTGRTADSS